MQLTRLMQLILKVMKMQIPLPESQADDENIITEVEEITEEEISNE